MSGQITERPFDLMIPFVPSVPGSCMYEYCINDRLWMRLSLCRSFKKTSETLSTAGQKTSAAFTTLGSAITRKFGDMRYENEVGSLRLASCIMQIEMCLLQPWLPIIKAPHWHVCISKPTTTRPAHSPLIHSHFHRIHRHQFYSCHPSPSLPLSLSLSSSRVFWLLLHPAQGGNFEVM